MLSTLLRLNPIRLPQSNSALMVRKRNFLTLLMELHNELLENVSPVIGQACARKLALTYKGGVAIQFDSELTALVDYCIYDYRVQNRTVIERCIDSWEPGENAEKLMLLRAMSRAKYSIYEVIGIEPNIIHVRNRLRNTEVFPIVDTLLSKTVQCGTLIAGRVISLDEFNSFNGAELPVDEEILEDALRRAHRILAARNLTWQEEADLHARIIRQCIEREYSALIMYA